MSFFESQGLKDAVVKFPQTFARAKADFAKFKEGSKRGLFTLSQKQEAASWFKDFPRLWETIRPNFEDVMLEQTGSVNVNFVPEVDAWVAKLKTDSSLASLGVIPIIIAGVLIVGGIAAATWAVGYVKRQNNVSRLIDEVVAGKIPADVLKDAVAKEDSSFFGDISGVLKWGAIGLAAWFLLPVAVKLLKGGKSA
jgi:hypothetical protein